MVETMKNRVLLTGANGFLGTQIARQLIHLPEIEIIAMVRAKDKKHARIRLERSWSDWGELQKALKDKIVIIPGDVTHEDLGMNDEDYQDLVSILTHIIHTVADLRLHAPLDDLRKTNLEGTENLLKLAGQAQENGIFKHFSHVSTAYVAGKREGLILEDPEVKLEANEANVNEINEITTDFWSNYEESKYEAEQAVLKSEVPYSIFRPGMVVGDSKTGDIKTFNTVYALFKLYLNGKLRIIPTSSFRGFFVNRIFGDFFFLNFNYFFF